MVEFSRAEVAPSIARRGAEPNRKPAKSAPLSSIRTSELNRLDAGDSDLNRVLGGGLVSGSVVLLGGEPGIGKSTLMLQAAMAMTNGGKKLLYVAGEESPQQVRMRAERLGTLSDPLWVLPETNTDVVIQEAITHEPDVVVVDSVQTLYHSTVDAAPGSVSQIRESSAALTRLAKERSIPVFLIGHITKEGSIAGPKVLEHMVDVVLSFEGERHHAYRMLRAAKNRFGTTSELGLYEMRGTGLAVVDHPSDVLLRLDEDDDLSGSAVAAALEGARPLLVEVQALVSTAVYGTPQRSGTGFDLRRLNMLLAVLEKRNGFKLGTKDVFLNMAGGLRIQDPALDLAVVASILSSTLDVPLPVGTVFAGEVGLSGEIRPVPRLPQRIAEAERMGMKRMFVSGHAGELASSEMKLVLVKRVSDLHGQLF
jgi:DNA repair protein RadA/Sms